MRIASVNADRGISPDRAKGAAVHLVEVRAALREAGADVVELDVSEADELRERLAAAHAAAPLDLIYERYALGAFAAGRFATQHGVPHVLEVNAPLSREARRYRPEQAIDVDEEAERALFAGASRIVAVSTAVARFARERGASAERVSRTANAVDPRRFRPLDDDARAARRASLGPVGNDTFLVGFHGRLRPWHNLPALARAVARLRLEGRDARLVTVGAGEYEAAVRPTLAGDAWLHRPWADRQEIAALVGSFDALALTYAADDDFYFSPLKLLEAMACGVPVVVPDLGDLTDWVTDDVEGLVVPAGDEEAVVAALRALADDPTRRRRLGDAGRVRAAAHTWARFAESVLELAREGVTP